MPRVYPRTQQLLKYVLPLLISGVRGSSEKPLEMYSPTLNSNPLISRVVHNPNQTLLITHVHVLAVLKVLVLLSPELSLFPGEIYLGFLYSPLPSPLFP